MTSTTLRDASPGGLSTRSWMPRAIGQTEVRIALGVAMVASVALALWLGRDTTFSVDEYRIFLSSQHLDLRNALDPLNGHLILVSRLVYAAILNTIGPGYLPFRLLTTATVLLTAGLFFVFAERRIGSLAALAPTLVLLFYGSDTFHMIVGNGFIVLLAVAAGLGALLALEREDLGGDIAACLLLCSAIASYSVAVPYVVGVAVLILIRGNRWRRAWVFLIPGLLYAGWFMWARGQSVGGGADPHFSNLLLAPDWAFNSLGTVGSALLGLDYGFSGFGTSVLLKLDTSWGPAVAVVAIVALGWRLWRGSVPTWLWGLLAIPVALWVLGAAVALPAIRFPQKSEYVFPATIAVLLVAVEAARGARFGRRAMIVLYGAAAIGVMTNVALLREGSTRLRTAASQVRSELAAVEIGDGRIAPQAGVSGPLGVVLLASQDGVATSYMQAVDQFGSPAFSLSELRGQPEPVRERADANLAANLGIRLQPASGQAGHCQPIAGDANGVRFKVPPGGAVLKAQGASAPLTLRRFGTAFTVKAGNLAPTVPMALTIPRDEAPDAWYASSPAAAVAVCGR
jgi:hypothetical protein